MRAILHRGRRTGWGIFKMRCCARSHSVGEVMDELHGRAATSTDIAAENPSGAADGISIEPVVDSEISVVDDLQRTSLLGLDFVNAASLDDVVDSVLDGPRRDDSVVPALLTPNVDIMVHLDAANGSTEHAVFQRAQYVLPDGQPIVWVSRLFGAKLSARLPGSGLFVALWPRMIVDRVPAVVVASSELVADRLAAEHPRARFVVPPMFEANDEVAIGEIVDRILASAAAIRPSLVLVGIGNPKDARIIAALFDRWTDQLGPKPLCLGLGGSFSMYLQLKRRAPEWVQRIGMEWFYRFCQEPTRLFHRYFVRDAAFIGIVWRAWRAR